MLLLVVVTCYSLLWSFATVYCGHMLHLVAVTCYSLLWSHATAYCGHMLQLIVVTCYKARCLSSVCIKFLVISNENFWGSKLINHFLTSSGNVGKDMVLSGFHFSSEVKLNIQILTCQVMFSPVFCHGYEGKEDKNYSTKVKERCRAENVTD